MYSAPTEVVAPPVTLGSHVAKPSVPAPKATFVPMLPETPPSTLRLDKPNVSVRLLLAEEPAALI